MKFDANSIEINAFVVIIDELDKENSDKNVVGDNNDELDEMIGPSVDEDEKVQIDRRINKASVS